jgi:hypothetical protein
MVRLSGLPCVRQLGSRNIHCSDNSALPGKCDRTLRAAAANFENMPAGDLPDELQLLLVGAAGPIMDIDRDLAIVLIRRPVLLPPPFGFVSHSLTSFAADILALRTRPAVYGRPIRLRLTLTLPTSATVCA